VNHDEVAFELILHGGNARAEAYEALKAARKGDFTGAEEHIKKANDEIKAAHEIQTKLLHSEASSESGETLVPTMLLVHAHAHLMTAMAERNLIEEMVEIYRKLY